MRGGEPDVECFAAASGPASAPINITEAVLDRAECLAMLAEAHLAGGTVCPPSLEEQFISVFGEAPGDVAASASGAAASGAVDAAVRALAPFSSAPNSRAGRFS